MLKSNLLQSASYIKEFSSDKKGNVAIIFALALLPVIAAIGMGVDYSRLSDAKSLMQSATDSAALASVIEEKSTFEQKQARALKAVRSVMSQKSWVKYNEADVKLTIDKDGGYTVAFETSVDTSIMAVLGFDKMDAKASSTARKGLSKKVEIALALDNTGSMQDSGIAALKVAANDFVTQVFSKSSKGQLKIGIVPFVGVVNPGLKYIDNADMADYDGQADYHGYYFAGQNVDGACDPGGAAPDNSAGKGGTNENIIIQELEDVFGLFSTKFAYITQELIGIKAVKALPYGRNGGGTTGATDFNTIINWPPHSSLSKNDPAKPTEAKVFTPGSVRAPATSTSNDFYLDSKGCMLYNPLRVNHFDLFKRTGPTGIAWKGCVMARKDPYDIDDSEPNSDANTKFVPFFWPSEPMSQKQGSDGKWNIFGDKINDPTSNYANNYMSFKAYNNFYTDLRSTTTHALGYYGQDPINSFAEILKYNGTDNNNDNNRNLGKAIQSNNDSEDAFPASKISYGPNKGCPNPVTPLTNSESKLHEEINKLTHWDGGGTVTSEGLMWAWRVLSPFKPYAMGAPYSDLRAGKVQKYIILMTDGENNLNPSGPKTGSNPITSQQVAYGSLWDNRSFAPQIVGLINSLRGGPLPINTDSGSITTFNTGDPSGENGANDFLNDRFTKTCENAKAQGIKVFTIYFKSAGAASLSASGNDAKNYLTQCSIFAETDGGAKTPHFYYADNDAQLKETFRKIADSFSAGARLSK
jgi:Flp pilus assembly protein TadG